MTIGERLAARYCRRRTTYLAVLLWLVVTGIAAPLSAQLFGSLNDASLTALPTTAETRQAADRVSAAFPAPDGLVAVAVYARDQGLTAADKAKIDADAAAFTGLSRDRAAPVRTPSADGQAVLLSFELAGDDDAQAEAVDSVREQLRQGSPSGLRTELTGSAGARDDLSDAFGGMDVMLLVTTMGIVTLLLLVSYRSPVLWLIPIGAAYVAAVLASAVVKVLHEQAGLTVNFQSQTIMTVIVIGVGIDYALLLIARYREELRRHEDRHAAMSVALRRAFPAVAASAATVALSLLCLLAAGLPATHSLGPVCAVGVVAALLVMTTLLPALMMIVGRWVFWPFVPRFSPTAAASGDPAEGRGVWAAVARFVGRRPGPVWLGAAAVLGLLTLGIGNLSIGLTGGEAFVSEVGSARGQRLVEAHFPAGAVEPAEIVTRGASAGAVATAARGVDGVAQVSPPEASADGRWARISVVLADDPESRAAEHTVERLRDAVHAVPGAQALVGGETAETLDTDDAVARDTLVVVPLVLAVVLVMLALLLRAIVAPLVLVASVVLTYAAALGCGGLIFSAWGHTHLWNEEPLEAFLFLVALGVDYTIFLMTRAREEVATHGHRQGVLRALAVTGTVVTTAGIVLAATFSSLLVMPLVASVQIGVIVAVGVLLDTFVVRSLLVPALALHMGPRIWWPGRLSRSGGFQTSSGGTSGETPATAAPGSPRHSTERVHG